MGGESQTEKAVVELADVGVDPLGLKKFQLTRQPDHGSLLHGLQGGIVNVKLIVDELTSGHMTTRVEIGAVSLSHIGVRLDNLPEVELVARLRAVACPLAILLASMLTILAEVGVTLLELGKMRKRTGAGAGEPWRAGGSP